MHFIIFVILIIFKGEGMLLTSIEYKNLSCKESKRKQHCHKIDIFFHIDNIKYLNFKNLQNSNQFPINKTFLKNERLVKPPLKEIKFYKKKQLKKIKNIIIYKINQEGS
jgi:hypothetical protein